MDEPPPLTDAHPPREIARRVEELGVTKARSDALTLFLLAVLAGAFISIGALFSLVATTECGLGFGAARVFGGLVFSVGLILVVVAGAELFTGNNLLALAWASGRIGTGDVLRNWAIVYAGNVCGCLGTAALAMQAGVAALGPAGSSASLGASALQLAAAKAALPALECLARGILCNALVCLAVWLAMGGRTVADKILAIPLPVAAFVALGLEHSIANWFFLPYARALDPAGAIPWSGIAQNLACATAGNVLGGTLLVAGIYWCAYLRGGRET